MFAGPFRLHVMRRNKELNGIKNLSWVRTVGKGRIFCDVRYACVAMWSVEWRFSLFWGHGAFDVQRMFGNPEFLLVYSNDLKFHPVSITQLFESRQENNPLFSMCVFF